MGACKRRLTDFQEAEAKNLDLRYEVFDLARRFLSKSDRHALMRKFCSKNLYARAKVSSMDAVERQLALVEKENKALEAILEDLSKQETALLVSAQSSAVEEAADLAAMVFSK